MTNETNAAADPGLTVAKNTVVEFHYKLHNASDELLESTEGDAPRAFLVGHRGVLAGVEEAMLGHATGDSLSITLPPERAFGLRDEKLQERISKKYLKHVKRLVPGVIAQMQTKNGPKPVTVLKVGSKVVDVDLNHPRAGQTLTFAIDVVSIREATGEELAHGHAHAPGGHHH